MTWIDYRDLMREYAPDVKLAKDLPHQIQDRMNALPPLFRRSDMARALLEAAISANTAEDEPTAPPISIINNIDDDVVPPWEFHYSNKLWHGDGVPLPNPLNLVSCDCEGPCNPKSKTCACVRRQAKYIDKETRIDGFMYDAYGRLKESGQPIFECNEFCGCSDDCTNRVVQHGRKCEIHIVKTKDKGWGVFAGNKKIPAGTFLGIYSGEILTEREGEERGIKYNKFGRTYLFDIDFGHLQSEDKDWSNTYVMDAYHAGNNHSCDPNCWINACYINEDNIQKPLLTIFTFRDVEPKEELCFSYYGEQDDENGDPGSPDAPGSDAVYRPCMCGTARCTGRMWKT
ncbi:hypothetical protein JAAARDRAFT_58145 [Jaapia argillacea MUCL 33604]|uniref:SET domain-containing protein n=1 Tax=Jaapia argillacea MUCL 33604 TaxID=933084 RepID=A0A067PS28_9AGAM|nr:hypothetical protein JAAARDRAFT_58145 [Jaapia argillacea MUCL 33604]